MADLSLSKAGIAKPRVAWTLDWKEGLSNGHLEYRRFLEITGKDNLTVFSYPGRVKSPEWRRQLRRATVLDLQVWTYYNLY